MKHINFSLPALFACISLLPACAFWASPSDQPSDQPPQLVVAKQSDANGRTLYEWDRPQAFGKVVGDRKVLGDAACIMGRPDLEALGYHALAKDAEGKSIPGGGYFCGVKPQGDRPAAQPPQLLWVNGVLGWNQPSLFGAVPEVHKARGDAVCSKAQPGFDAAAFHPEAKDETGQPIVGGGFFCAPKRQSVSAAS